MMRQTGKYLCGIPSVVGQGQGFHENDNLFYGALGKFMRRYKSGGKGSSGYWQKVCPQCRLRGVWVWFQGKGASTQLRDHLHEHYAIRILGRDETQWAKDCQARQKRLRGVAGA